MTLRKRTEYFLCSIFALVAACYKLSGKEFTEPLTFDRLADGAFWVFVALLGIVWFCRAFGGRE